MLRALRFAAHGGYGVGSGRYRLSDDCGVARAFKPFRVSIVSESGALVCAPCRECHELITAVIDAHDAEGIGILYISRNFLVNL